MTTENTKALTDADRAALDALPDDEWFDVAHAPVARPSYRCQRLEAAGVLLRRVIEVDVPEALSFRTEYRRHPKPVADWSEAPEGTTHVMRQPGGDHVVWIKIVDPFDAYWRRPGAKNWRGSTDTPAMLRRRRCVEPRPAAPL